MRSIKYWRLRTGLTQTELAKKIGSNQPCISNWEDSGTEPKLYVLRRMAHIFGIDTAELLNMSPMQETELARMESECKDEK